jgi:hypothetical protein
MKCKGKGKGRRKRCPVVFLIMSKIVGVTMPLKPYDDICYTFLLFFVTVFVVSVQVA